MGEYEEWGDPQNRQFFNYMLSYSPYENVQPQSYPDILITAAWNDSRVGYWEGLKWTQRLRSVNRGQSQIIFRLMKDEGHSGSGNRFQSLRSYSEAMAYTLRLLGIRN